MINVHVHAIKRYAEYLRRFFLPRLILRKFAELQTEQVTWHRNVCTKHPEHYCNAKCFCENRFSIERTKLKESRIESKLRLTVSNENKNKQTKKKRK